MFRPRKIIAFPGKKFARQIVARRWEIYHVSGGGYSCTCCTRRPLSKDALASGKFYNRASLRMMAVLWQWWRPSTAEIFLLESRQCITNMTCWPRPFSPSTQLVALPWNFWKLTCRLQQQRQVYAYIVDRCTRCKLRLKYRQALPKLSIYSHFQSIMSESRQKKLNFDTIVGERKMILLFQLSW